MLTKLYVYIPVEDRYKEYDCPTLESAQSAYKAFTDLGDRALIVASTPEMHGQISKLLLNIDKDHSCCH
jgi:hypothetical protein